MLARRFKRPGYSYFMTLLLTTNRVYAIGFAFLLKPGRNNAPRERLTLRCLTS